MRELLLSGLFEQQGDRDVELVATQIVLGDQAVSLWTLMGRISRKLVRRRGLRFAFKGPEDEAVYECRLDGREYRRCDSPKRFELAALGGAPGD